MSSFWRHENISARRSCGRMDSVVFLKRSMLSVLSAQIAITFPRTLKCPPRISEILSFDRYCSWADKTTVPAESDKMKSTVPLCLSSLAKDLIFFMVSSCCCFCALACVFAFNWGFSAKISAILSTSTKISIQLISGFFWSSPSTSIKSPIFIFEMSNPDFRIFASVRNARNLDNKDTFVCTFSLVVFSVSPQFPEWDNSPFRSILSSLLKIEADVETSASIFWALLFSLWSE